jgi:Kef-type K+ transport system membrane component KefB
MGNAENLSAPAMLMAVGGLVFLAHIFQFAFQRFRVPDTLWLIGIGLVAGPVTHWLQPKDFRASWAPRSPLSRWRSFFSRRAPTFDTGAACN